MSPKLIAIAGPMRGTIFAVDADETVIGRDPSNGVALEDRAVSRRHCALTREGGLFKLRDFGSHNGTLVNDVPASEQTVAHGDRIKIGNSHFLFLVSEDAEPVPPQDVRYDGTLVTGSTIRLRLEDVLSLLAHDLHALLKVGALLVSAGTVRELLRQLLEAVFETVPAARRGAIVLTDGGLETAVITYAADRHSGQQEVGVSRTVAQQVLREGVAILSNDVLETEGLSGSESLIASRIRSLLCVPLSLRDRVTGIIYLDTADADARFDERHLQMVTAVARFAAGTLENARRVEWLEGENRRLREDLRVEHNMVGESPRMREVYQQIARIGPASSTVLLLGESGTGKELAARAIHQNSPRAGKPFVAINCAALTETLMESELFGHERGAFTGAVAQKKGKLEVADGGTLFLDEVGELAPPLQAKLLRVLQEREFERVGGTRTIRVDVRVVAATNRNLAELAARGEFRQDLFYRLNVVSLTMPALRERPGDVPLLAGYFVLKYSQRCKRSVTGISAAARRCLSEYAWPGNVRELENAVERAVVLGSTEEIMPEDLPETILEAAPPPSAEPQAGYYAAVREAKRQFITRAVEQAEGNYTEAARLLGVHPNNLHRLIRNLDLRPPRTR